MQKNLSRTFISSLFVILLITGLLKIISSFGDSILLMINDPIIPIKNRYIFLSVGTLEIIISLVCLLSRNILLQASLILWLSLNFVFYRIGLYMVGYHKPCKCLGNIVNVLNLNDEAADLWMKFIIVYMLLGSILILRNYRAKVKTI